MGKEKDDYFKIRPANRKYVMTELESLYGICFNVTDDEFDEAEKEENSNIHFYQSQVIKRKIVLKRAYHSILPKSSEYNENINKFFNYSWGKRCLEQAEDSFKFGLFPSTIILCRSALETGIREAISLVNAISKGTSFLQEY